MPRARIITVKASDYYKLRGTEDGVRPVAAAVIDQLIDGLRRPLTAQETSTAPKKEALDPITITAPTYDLAAQKFNQVFLDNQWGDGLPMLPPTKEAVQAMLKGTSRSPSEVIGKVAPKNGIVTIEKIAINSVMAGAKPEYLPVIIAAMEGMTVRL